MEINAYIYIKQTDQRKNKDMILCFRCAVKEVFKPGNRTDAFVLTLEEGDTGCGNDMRSAPSCSICHEMFNDFGIA